MEKGGRLCVMFVILDYKGVLIKLFCWYFEWW